MNSQHSLSLYQLFIQFSAGNKWVITKWNAVEKQNCKYFFYSLQSAMHVFPVSVLTKSVMFCVCSLVTLNVHIYFFFIFPPENSANVLLGIGQTFTGYVVSHNSVVFFWLDICSVCSRATAVVVLSSSQFSECFQTKIKALNTGMCVLFSVHQI